MSASSFRVQQIDHVEIFVPDRYEAAKWYAEVLGLEILEDYESWAVSGGPLMISSDEGNTKLALFEGDPKTAPYKRIAFRVDGPGFIEFLRRLETNPIQHDSGEPLLARQVVDHEQAFSIYFVDPYGNRFEVTTYEYAHVMKHLSK